MTFPDGFDDLDLLPQHAKLLADSAIAPGVAKARGYRSVTVKAELERLGFGRNQRIVPSLLIPIFDIHGEIAFFQNRPDDPRRDSSGKPVKYETPIGSRMVIDVHPAIRGGIGDPNVALFITEGIRKADAAVSRGLCCVALLGVWNWKGRNSASGVTALADWELITLKDRRVYIVFDSDAAVKQQVEMAMHRLKRFLEARGADVHILYLRSAPDGSKVGLDDFFARGGTTPELLTMHSPAAHSGPSAAPLGDESTAPYVIEHGHFAFEKQTKEGPVLVPLCNFRASVQEEIILDDGEVVTRAFAIDGALDSGQSLPQARVPVDRFPSMYWVPSEWGLHAIIGAGAGTKDRVREAIQKFSPKATSRHVYTHTGWRRIDGRWGFLTAGGAIGLPQLEVDLPDELRHYCLPSRAEDPKSAMRQSLRLLKVADLDVTAPLWAAVFRAPLAQALPLDMSVWIEGFTGAMKSTLAALFLSHFGAFTRTTLPGAWSSTVNHLERRAFILKDLVFVIDDFAPTPADHREMVMKAARILRSQGNLSGRGRLRSDLTEHRTFFPRGLVLSTGEERAAGQSILARSFLVELEIARVDKNLLTEAQANTAVLPHATSGYVDWLAPQMDSLPRQLAEEFHRMRSRAAQTGAHLRVPETVAHLALGIDCGLAYAQEIGACSAPEADELRLACWESLMNRARANAAIVDGNRPSRLFLEVLQTLIDQSKVTILRKTVSPEITKKDTTFVGWEDDDHYFLIPNAIHQAVSKFCRDAGEAFPVGQTRLQQDLRRENLTRTDTNRTTATTWIAGGTRRVLCLRKAAVSAVLGQGAPESSPVLTGLTGFSEGERDGV